MNALREMGQESVELLYAAKEVSYAASNDVKGEFDGIVATASHLFVVEAKLHAKVAHEPTRFDVLMTHCLLLALTFFRCLYPRCQTF